MSTIFKKKHQQRRSFLLIQRVLTSHRQNRPDFGIAGHFVDGVVDVHCVLDHRAVFKHLDLLGHASDGKVVAVSVKLDAERQQLAVEGSGQRFTCDLDAASLPSRTWRRCWSRCTGRWRTTGWPAASPSCSGWILTDTPWSRPAGSGSCRPLSTLRDD